MGITFSCGLTDLLHWSIYGNSFMWHQWIINYSACVHDNEC